MSLKLPELDFMKVERRIEAFIRRVLEKTGREGLVLGLSGGLDSSVAALLCARAVVGSRVKGLIMPDVSVTPNEDVEDALKLAEALDIEYKVMDISQVVKYMMDINPYRKPSDLLAEGNVRARVRMIMLYYVANVHNLLVVGTSDRSEFMIGYFTKYGDGGADLLPIGGLYKTQVRKFARYLNLPSRIVEKPSSPRLWKDQTAEGELGLSYEVIDLILHGLYDLKLSLSQVAEIVGVGLEAVGRVRSMVERSIHKRRMPPILRIL